MHIGRSWSRWLLSDLVLLGRSIRFNCSCMLFWRSGCFSSANSRAWGLYTKRQESHANDLRTLLSRCS
jgi:hypothetical protein